MAAADDVQRPAVVSALDHGFSGLYNLDFSSAQKDFAAWQPLHPDDPAGPPRDGTSPSGPLISIVISRSVFQTIAGVLM
jgi:hypothetical protein